MEKEMTDFKGPLFVVGCPRSGTTLMVNILNGNRKIKIMVGETGYIENIYGNRTLIGGLENEKSWLTIERYLNERKDKKKEWAKITLDKLKAEYKTGSNRSYSGLYLALMKVFVKTRYGITPDSSMYIGAKNPKDLLYTKEILRLYPNAKIINILRDGRSVTASILNSYVGPKSLIKAILLWKKFIRYSDFLQNTVPKRNLLTVKYEDITNDPKYHVKRLCDFLEIDYEKNMLKDFVTDGNSSFNTDGSSDNAGIDRERIDRYKTVLTKEQIEFIEKICFQELTDNGYTTSLNTNNPSKYILGKVFLTNFLFKIKSCAKRYSIKYGVKGIISNLRNSNK